MTGTVADPSSTFATIGEIAFTPDGRTGFVTNGSTARTVSVIDMATFTVTGVLNDPLGTIDESVNIVFSSDGTIGFITNLGGSVSVLNTDTLTVTARVNDTLFPFSSPFGIAYFAAPAADFIITGRRKVNRFLTETDSFITLSWYSEAVESFQIYRGAELLDVVEGEKALTFTDHNLTPNRAYTYRVILLSSTGSALAEGVVTLSAK